MHNSKKVRCGLDVGNNSKTPVRKIRTSVFNDQGERMMAAHAIAANRIISHILRSITVCFSIIVISLTLTARSAQADQTIHFDQKSHPDQRSHSGQKDNATVLLWAPTNGAFFSEGANITVSATPKKLSGQTITKVDFYQGGTLIATDTSPPYSIIWSSVPVGSYSLTAKATSSTGAVTVSRARSITVLSAPIVSLTAPANNSTFATGSSITLFATATATGQKISKVDFYRGTTLISSDTSAPYTATWRNVATGSYSLTAKVTTKQKLTATSIPVAITVATSPTINLTAPTNNAVFTAGADVTISASAAAPGQTITQLDFYQGNTLIGTDTTSPYSVNWSAAQAGIYTLTAKLTTNTGATTTSAARNVSIASAPSVTITSPANNTIALAPASFTLSATAAASSGLSISKVDYYSGATLLGTAATAPFSFKWSNVQAGSYSLTAKATDSLGGVSTSAAVAVGVKVNSPPTVMLTAPAGNSNFIAPANITLTANATDSDGIITQVDFYADNSKIGTLTAAPYNINWNNVVPGTYQLTAAATDNLGAVSTSAPVNVTVNIYNPVNITISSPAAGATINDDSVLVTGTFQGLSNTGITVNGIVAAQYGNNFYALAPLNTGVNTLNITATTITGNSFTQTLDVVSSGPAPLQLEANPMSGVAPLNVSFSVQNNTVNAIALIDADFNGDGTSDLTTADSTAALKYLYTTPGVYQANFKITDSQYVVMEKTVLVVVQDTAQIDQTIKAQWKIFTDMLTAGDKQQAMTYLSDRAQLKYGPVFDLLMPSFSQIIPTWSPLQISSITGEMAEYAVVTSYGNKRQLFYVYFILGADGVWRLESM